MFNLHLIDRKWAAVAAILFFLFLPLTSRAEKGTMQIGLASHWAAPQMDLSELDPGLAYGLIFHYWLNDTTTIVVGYEEFRFDGPLEIDGEDEGLEFTTNVIMFGARYRPEVDFFLGPYLEMGVGYQTWKVNPDPLDSRSGGTMAYLAGVGIEQDILHAVTLSAGLRYLYMPMGEKIETEATMVAADTYEVEKDELVDGGYITAGVELVWKFK